MDSESSYEVDRTAEFIHRGNFSRVALQFPDELLKDSTRVVSALKSKISSIRHFYAGENREDKEVGLFVMADTTFGSCCVDEVGALHVDADCIIHYGHTCLSPTSTLPAFFVFGKASISISDCTKNLSKYASTGDKPIIVLYGLEYAHAIPLIKEAITEESRLHSPGSELNFHFSDVRCSYMTPLQGQKNLDDLTGLTGGCSGQDNISAPSGTRYACGGLIWDIHDEHKIEDHLLFWIGSNNSAFANVVLTFNGYEIVRYDAREDRLVTDFSQQRRILKRRYFLVEKAKDANIIGILVGTLGVAGYLHMIHQIKALVTAAGKKAYTLVMGKPNPAKLANFPECDVFVLVSCAQTALLDSKEFLAPVITPYEAMLAFSRGSEWTGAYVTEFRDLINSSPVKIKDYPEEARFSFLQGGYVEDFDLRETEPDEGDNEGTLALVNATEKALRLRDKTPNTLAKTNAKSGPEFFLTRSYQGLEIDANKPLAEPYVVGRIGKASGYEDTASMELR